MTLLLPKKKKNDFQKLIPQLCLTVIGDRLHSWLALATLSSMYSSNSKMNREQLNGEGMKLKLIFKLIRDEKRVKMGIPLLPNKHLPKNFPIFSHPSHPQPNKSLPKIFPIVYPKYGIFLTKSANILQSLSIF